MNSASSLWLYRADIKLKAGGLAATFGMGNVLMPAPLKVEVGHGSLSTNVKAGSWTDVDFRTSRTIPSPMLSFLSTRTANK